MSEIITTETIRKMSRDELLDVLGVDDTHESGDSYQTDDDLRDLYAQKLCNGDFDK